MGYLQARSERKGSCNGGPIHLRHSFTVVNSVLVQSRAESERTTARRIVSSIVATALFRWESVMLRSALCAIALSFLLVGCYEAKDPVHRHGILVKTCPNHRIFYTFQNKLYLKEGNRYRHVESNDFDVCGQIAML